jgi:hypothetical protein
MIEKNFFTEVVLLTKSRNLQDFKDWMHWHMDIIGFQRCHVFDNESSVDIKSVCDGYGDRVTYELVRGWPNQYALYNRYINNESPAWWVLPIDDDEFLWMKSFTNVNQMLMHYVKKWPDMNKLSIRWKNMFPEDPCALRGNRSLMDFCTKSNEQWAALFDGGNKPVKTFVRTVEPILYSIEHKQTHNPIINNTPSFLCNGARLIGNWYTGETTDDAVKLLHFQYKSKAEWEWKCNNRRRVSMQKDGLYQKCRLNIWEKMK